MSKRISSIPLVKTKKHAVTTLFDGYLEQYYQYNSGSLKYETPQSQPILSSEDIVLTSSNPLRDFRNIDEKNRQLRQQRCPILNPSRENLPSVPNSTIPPLPTLGFLKQLDVPIIAMAPMFGGIGKASLKAVAEYAATRARDEIIKLSQGDRCVIEIANKLYISMKSASDLQYLMSQPVLTTAGPGAVLPV